MKNVMVSVVLGLTAATLGIAVAQSTEAWLEGMEQGQRELERAKRDLVSIPGIFEEHNKVFSKLGSQAWENRVKPEFMSAITRRTVHETGNPFPAVQDVLDWTRAHAAEARKLLRDLGDLP